MFLYNRLIGWLKPLAGLLCRGTSRVTAFFRRSVMGRRAPNISGLPGSILDTDLYKVGQELY
jgi:hypothetical protein